MRIPFARAERLKIEEGDAQRDRHLAPEYISRKGSGGFADTKVSRETMNDIIYARMRETIGEIKERIESSGVRLDSLRAGVHLTGGGSILRGVGGLARDIFNSRHVSHR